MNDVQISEGGFDRLRRLLVQQIGLLDHEAVLGTPNRQGLRERSGQLLEAAFLDLATRLTPTLSVEIGAHEASFSERLKARLPNVHALAFEANPYVYRLHAERLRQQGISIEYKNTAICREDGIAQLQIPVRQDGVSIGPHNAISSLYRRVRAGFEYEVSPVPALSLDAALTSLSVSGSVGWIDAEGAQGEILAGGRHFFSQVAAIYIEVERKQSWRDQKVDKEVAEILAGHSLVPIMQDNLASGQYNQVYIRANDSIAATALSAVLWYTHELRSLVDGV